MLDVLNDLEHLCEWLEQQPRKAGYVRVRGIWYVESGYVTLPAYKAVRDGVIFYSSGWGWRLRKDWRATLAAKRAQAQGV